MNVAAAFADHALSTGVRPFQLEERHPRRGDLALSAIETRVLADFTAKARAVL